MIEIRNLWQDPTFSIHISKIFRNYSVIKCISSRTDSSDHHIYKMLKKKKKKKKKPPLNINGILIRSIPAYGQNAQNHGFYV
jgi:hypothetical protein